MAQWGASTNRMKGQVTILTQLQTLLKFNSQKNQKFSFRGCLLSYHNNNNSHTYSRQCSHCELYIHHDTTFKPTSGYITHPHSPTWWKYTEVQTHMWYHVTHSFTRSSNGPYLPKLRSRSTSINWHHVWPWLHLSSRQK